MGSLMVRNLDERVIEVLNSRSVRHGRSAEAEHRVILEGNLLGTRRRSLAEVLAKIPDVGRDEDFERVEAGRVADVLD
jgi:antitoxin FitA